jgi:hypothetical protein
MIAYAGSHHGSMGSGGGRKVQMKVSIVIFAQYWAVKFVISEINTPMVLNILGTGSPGSPGKVLR